MDAPAVPALPERHLPLTGRILIVDDQAAGRVLLQRILERAGFPELRAVADAREAVTVFRDFRPDIVLLDLHMPHLDGFGVMAALRTQVPEGEYLPVLMLTADTQTETKTRALAEGAADFLAKPFDKTEVVLRVSNLLRARQMQAELASRHAALRVSEKDLKAVFESSLDALMLIDPDYRVRALNGVVQRRILENFGVTFRPGDSLIQLCREYNSGILEDLEPVFRGEAFIVEREVQRADSSSYWVSASYSPVWDEERVVGAVYSSRDISAYKQLQASLAQEARFRQALSELMAESLDSSLGAQLYERLLARAVEVIPGAEAGSLLLREGEVYRFVAAVGFNLAALQKLYLYPHEIALPLHLRRPQRIRDFSANRSLDTKRQQLLEEVSGSRTIQVALAIPIVLHDEVLAVFNLDNFSDPDGFSDEAVAMVEPFARQIGVLLQRLGLEAQLVARQAALEHANQELETLANYDMLTGLANRTLFGERLGDACAEAAANGRLVGLLFVDLDGFKWVNDALGHEAGDRLLQEVARRLSACVRDSDTPARLGGDEFTLILKNLKDAADAAAVAQKVLESLRQPFYLERLELKVQASIGIALYPQDSRVPAELVTYADSAMYRAKESGKNSYRFFRASEGKNTSRRLRLERDLAQALEHDGLSLAYQPRIDLKRGHITSLEALARWQHPDFGAVSPGEFIALAEDCGLISPLGEWVLREACRQAQAFAAAGYPLRMAVNLSVRQLGRPGLVEEIRSILASSGLAAHMLELEITESAAMTQVEGNIMVTTQPS